MKRVIALAAVFTVAVSSVPLLASPAGATPAGVETSRYGGADRYATSLLIAEAVAADAGGRLESVVLVSGRRWTDAVVAAPLAGSLGAAVLATPPGELRSDAAAFLERAGVTKAWLIGADSDSAGVGLSVVAGLAELGIDSERISGTDQYTTAAAVADRIGLPGEMGRLGRTAVVASGEVFADALVAGAFASRGSHPVLLTPADELHRGAAAYLTGAEVEHVVLMGGIAALSAEVEASIEAIGVAVTRVAGRTRYDTAVKAAELTVGRYSSGCFSSRRIGLARARVPFDSFSAGPLLGRRCAPLLLADPDAIPDDTAAHLDSIRRDAAESSRTSVDLYVFGGDAAISQSAVDSYLRPWPGPDATCKPDFDDPMAHASSARTEVRPTNPTAPTALTRYLSGNLTDTDGDGMTDAAERKYGFDPCDGASFPTRPEIIRPQLHPITGTGIGARYEILPDAIRISWEPPDAGRLALGLKTSGADDWNIVFGAHSTGYFLMRLSDLSLTGDELLTGQFLRYGEDRQWIRSHPEFDVDLSAIDIPDVAEAVALVGIPSNRVSYTLGDGFPEDSALQYREFLDRVFPILYEYLGPPAETFNILIRHDGLSFVSLDDGRTIVGDGSFVPRLIVHEMAHAWKGGYAVANDENWEYDVALTGFEEGLAEGIAFEIVREYVRSYPTHQASVQLLNYGPSQYWPRKATYYDLIRRSRWTGGGDFFTPSGHEAATRYDIVSTTVQMMLRKNPDFVIEFMSRYYETIRADLNWRPNRADVVRMWESVVPELNGYSLSDYLDTVPAFNGRDLDEGVYILSTVRQYGGSGDQQFAVSYALPDGRLWWGVHADDTSLLKNIPPWIRTVLDENGVHNIDTQRSDFVVEVFDSHGQSQLRKNYRTRDLGEGGEYVYGFGWYFAEELKMERFPFGLYKETVTFVDFIAHDEGAREDFYFFGAKDFEQDRDEEYVIIIGIDGVAEGTAEIVINGRTYASPIRNGAAAFKSRVWPAYLQGEFPITITNTASETQIYHRTVVEAATSHFYFQHQFVIVDTDFNGVEDEFE